MTAVATRQPEAVPVLAASDLVRIDLAELHESPLNPRTRYDEHALQELAASLLSSGQLTPIIVRPRKAGGYELAAGHRRFRAAKLACQKSPDGAKYRGLQRLLAVVRELDDKTFVEILNIENLQRDDLHPLEEAQGFRDLMQRAGYDVAKIASRIGRSEKYVYDRIKLLQLTKESQKLFWDGEITAGHAILLARLSPADQKRAIGNPAEAGMYDSRVSGLFRPDASEDEFALEDAIQPRSVRELQQWINDNVRMTQEKVDPFLFPETAQVLRQAQEEEEKVVHITHDYRVPDGARDEKQRTYGEASWKRADGKKKSKACDSSVVGVVVAGPGRGEAFRVCVDKKKCTVHWAAEIRASAKRATGTSASTSASTPDRYAQERQRQQEAQARANEERARWKKATPAILKSMVTRIKTARQPGASSPIGRYVLDYVRSDVGVPPSMQASPGRTADDLVRYLGMLLLADVLADWNVANEAPRVFKSFGVNAQKIVDQVAPKPQPVQTAAKASTKKKGGSRAARRS